MTEVIKKEGEHIAYTVGKNSVTFGDDDLSINLKNREKDEKVLVDVCYDRNGDLVIGCANGFKYAAQIEIPPREYTDGEPEIQQDMNGEEVTVIPKVAVPFDIEKCTIYLWG